LEPLATKLRNIEPEASFQVLGEPSRILYSRGNLRTFIDQKMLESLSMYEYKLLLQAYKQVEDVCLNEKAVIFKDNEEEASVSDR
ncbi:MAG: hypothetical protein ABR539_13980, partial [Halomonas sp.]